MEHTHVPCQIKINDNFRCLFYKFLPMHCGVEGNVLSLWLSNEKPYGMSLGATQYVVFIKQSFGCVDFRGPDPYLRLYNYVHT